jgi:hypothetical protein
MSHYPFTPAVGEVFLCGGGALLQCSDTNGCAVAVRKQALHYGFELFSR